MQLVPNLPSIQLVDGNPAAFKGLPPPSHHHFTPIHAYLQEICQDCGASFADVSLDSRPGAELCSTTACSSSAPARPRHRLLQDCSIMTSTAGAMLQSRVATSTTWNLRAALQILLTSNSSGWMLSRALQGFQLQGFQKYTPAAYGSAIIQPQGCNQKLSPNQKRVSRPPSPHALCWDQDSAVSDQALDAGAGQGLIVHA